MMKFMFVSKCFVAGLLACSVAGIANAQPGGGRGGPGGGFGGGGFGRTNSVISLATNEVIQKELKINEVIAESLKEISDSYRAEMQKAMGDGGGFANFRDMSEEERQKAMDKMAETRRTVTNKFLPELKDALTPEQFKRLREIYVQSLRDQAYSDTEVAKALGLTKDQSDKIAEIGKDYTAKMREAFQPGGGGAGGAGGRPDFTAMRTKMEEMNKERDAKLNDVLNKDQQAKFKELKGQEFDLAQLQPRGGFGGPGGGAPGGQGGRPGGGRPGQGGRPQGDSATPKAAPTVD